MTCPYKLIAWDISGTLQNQSTGLLFEGLKPVLESLKAAGVQLAICTDLGSRRAHAFVEENRLEHIFNSVQHTSMNPFKPEKDMLQMAMIDCAIEDAQHVCMIGDSPCDIALAHAVKSDSIYVSYGGFNPSALHEKPLHVASSIEELRKILKV